MANKKLTVMLDERLYNWLKKQAEVNFSNLTEVTKRYLLDGMKAEKDYDEFLKSLNEDESKENGA